MSYRIQSPSQPSFRLGVCAAIFGFVLAGCAAQGHSPGGSDGKSDSLGPQPAGDTWGPLVELKDDTDTFAEDKPAGGWWVTPIHANLLADGKVLITGWGRRDHDHCMHHGTRKNGTSFLLDPDALSAG